MNWNWRAINSNYWGCFFSYHIFGRLFSQLFLLLDSSSRVWFFKKIFRSIQNFNIFQKTFQSILIQNILNGYIHTWRSLHGFFDFSSNIIECNLILVLDSHFFTFKYLLVWYIVCFWHNLHDFAFDFTQKISYIGDNCTSL